MIASALRRRVAPALVLAAVAWSVVDAEVADAAAGPARPAESRSVLRLIAGAPPAGGPVLRAGVQIDLAPGWKTYWRHPGDAGVPPRFDFSASTNLRSVDVAWPAPIAWRDDGGVSFGYKDMAILPLRVTPQDPSRPVELALAFDYAICERICVPVSGTAALTLPASRTEEAALAQAEARVPKPRAIGPGEGLTIRSVRREGDWPRPRIVVEVAAPAETEVSLFAEGPTPDWALPAPEPAGDGPDGVRRFAFALEGAPPGVEPNGATLRLTAVTAAEAVETSLRLD